MPEELIRWFPERVDGSLAVGTRSTLVFPDQRVWWDVTVLESDRRFEFHVTDTAGWGTMATHAGGQANDLLIGQMGGLR